MEENKTFLEARNNLFLNLENCQCLVWQFSDFKTVKSRYVEDQYLISSAVLNLPDKHVLLTVKMPAFISGP